MARPSSSVGSLLQYWRKARRLSQLDLAHQADVSARHLCFVENGRARPSREMVLLLADTLDVPLRERNQLLLAAGFAPQFDETPLDAPAIASVRVALDAILRQQEPFPAVVMNRRWDLLLANTAATRFFARMLDGNDAPQPANIVRMMFDPSRLRPRVRNWPTVARALLHRIEREAVGGVRDHQTIALVEEVLGYAGARDLLGRLDITSPSSPIIPISFALDDEPAFNFFSTVTTLGTPQDITLQELRIECFFPADDDTERRARALAATPAAYSSSP